MAGWLARLPFGTWGLPLRDFRFGTKGGSVVVVNTNVVDSVVVDELHSVEVGNVWSSKDTGSELLADDESVVDSEDSDSTDLFASREDSCVRLSWSAWLEQNHFAETNVLISKTNKILAYPKAWMTDSYQRWRECQNRSPEYQALQWSKTPRTAPTTLNSREHPNLVTVGCSVGSSISKDSIILEDAKPKLREIENEINE